jgi:starch synthase (maltosyl-transferring)
MPAEQRGQVTGVGKKPTVKGRRYQAGLLHLSGFAQCSSVGWCVPRPRKGSPVRRMRIPLKLFGILSGAPDAGHPSAVHPELGTLDDFRSFVVACQQHAMEVALDFAVQCSPDHPWLREHPEWFRKRPDGSMRCAENPPKKYEDIVNPDFDAQSARALWDALRDVILFWVDQGVRIFRVDNPHTKPFPFWEWLIADVQARHPDVIFLAEAFTRPKVMKALAKLGFTQSYTYFTWRTHKWETEDYL